MLHFSEQQKSFMMLYFFIHILFQLYNWSFFFYLKIMNMAVLSMKKALSFTLGKANMNISPYFFNLLMILLVGNIYALNPYLVPWTSHLISMIMISMACYMNMLMFYSDMQNLYTWKILATKNTPWYLILLMIPMELLSFMIRAISLGNSFGANMLSGHCLLILMNSINFYMIIFWTWKKGFLLKLGMLQWGINKKVAIALCCKWGKKLILTLIMLIIMLPITTYSMITFLEQWMAILQVYVFLSLLLGYTKDVIKLH